MPLTPFGSYHPRRVSPLGMWTPDDWRVKVYGIATYPGPPAPALIAHAKVIAQKQLLHATQCDPRQHGIAVLTVHEGENGDYVLIDWWSDNDILRHYNYGAPKGHGGQLAYHWPGPGACVWEMAITAFERQAWIDHVMQPPGQADLDAYLAAWLDGDV